MAYITMYQGKGGAVDIWEEYTQNVTNNTSTLTIIAYVKKTNSSYYSYRQSPRTFTLTVNGVASTLGWTFDFRNMTLNQRYEIMRTSRTFTHNADGSKSATPVSVYCETGTDGLGTVSGSTSVAIATIPRASIPTLNVSTQALGSVITISTNRASSSFTHTITYNFGGLTGTIATGVTTSSGWTLPSTLASKMANSSSGVGTIYLYTYSGSTHIGTKTIAFTATVPSNATYNPTISISSVSIYGSGRDNTIEKYVQGISRVSVVSAPVARQSATIKSTTITVARSTNSMSYSGTSATSGVLTLSGTYTVTVSTVDSRGRSASASTTFTSEAYAVPKINAFTAKRTTGKTVATVRSGTYTYMGGSNSLSVSVQRAVRGGSFTALENTAGTTNGTFGGTYNPTGNSETTSYDFKLVISDSFGKTAEAIVSVSTSSVALSIKGDVGIGVGKVRERGALDVGGDAYIGGKAYLEDGLILNGQLISDGNNYTSSTKQRFQNPNGYIDIGSMNSGFAHIYTDRDDFYLNKNIRIMGDYPVTSGANSNGTYIKFYDGALICYGNMTLTYDNANQYSGSWTYPHDFVDDAIVVGSRSAANVGNVSGNAASFVVDGSKTGAYARFFGVNNGFVSGLAMIARVVAYGRWK